MTSAATPSTGPRYRECQRRFLLVRLVTEVREDGLYVRLGPIQRSFRRIPFEDVATVETTTYSAADHGGWHWGLRVGPGGDTTYRLSGTEGVLLRLTDGTEVFVGSRRPRELHAAVADGASLA